jgi:NAD(P)-dependent dehydrogenase (short-subunit alcohol dehydrogenase family)
MLFSLHNKKAAITGAGSGIGLAIAQVFAQQGAEVYILDLNEATAQAAVQSILDQGGKASAYACDVSNQTQMKAIFQEIGALDILVNNAGIAHIGNAENTSEADFDRVMNINVKGVYNCLHAAIPLMKAKGGGVILNMASIAATIGIPDRLAYSTAKGAVLSMTLATAKDYLKHNIRCNCISPARVHTPFVDGFLSKNYPGQEAEMFDKLSKTQPIGRMAKPVEVAYLALYLCSEEAGFITGCDYPLDGGFTRLNN